MADKDVVNQLGYFTVAGIWWRQQLRNFQRLSASPKSEAKW